MHDRVECVVTLKTTDFGHSSPNSPHSNPYANVKSVIVNILQIFLSVGK